MSDDAPAPDAKPRRQPEGFRSKPHNLDAELLIVGALLANNRHYEIIKGKLRAEHFYEPGRASVYRDFETDIAQYGRVDWLTFDHGHSREGIRKLAELGSTVMAADVELYAGQIIDCAKRRALIDVAKETENRAYDVTLPESASEQINILRRSIDERLSGVSVTSSVDWLDFHEVAELPLPPERWLLEPWMPVGTAGLLAGPGSAGKSYLEMMRLICLTLGLEWLGYKAPEGPCCCLGLFSEDSRPRLHRRARLICDALSVDPHALAGRLFLRSTVGQAAHLIIARDNSELVEPTDLLHQLHDFARANGVRYIVADHVGRYALINRNNPNHVFSMFGHLEALAASIDGAVTLLAHPSKSDIRAGQGPKVGGSVAMIDAPRYVHNLESRKDEANGGKYRVLTSEKANYVARFAIKLVENQAGIVENVGDIDPDDAKTGDNVGSGRPSKAHQTLAILRELYAIHRRAIHLEEIVDLCVERGIITHAEPKGQNRTAREHLHRFPRQIDARDDGTYALMPGV